MAVSAGINTWPICTCRSALRPAIENLKAAFEAISPVIIPILEGIGNHTKNIATILADTASLILAIVSGDWSKAWGDAKAIFGDFIQLFTDDVTAIKDAFTAAIPLAVEAAKAFGSAVAGAVEDAFSGVVGFVTSVINGIIDAYNSTLGKIPGAPNISRIGGGGGGSSQGYDPNDPTGQHVGGGGAWEAGIAGLAGGGGGGSGWNDLSWPGGMGTPSMNYRDPRGVTLTANDILNMRASSIVIPVTLMLNDQVVYEAVARHGGRIMA